MRRVFSGANLDMGLAMQAGKPVWPYLTSPAEIRQARAAGYDVLFSPDAGFKPVSYRVLSCTADGVLNLAVHDGYNWF